MLIGNKIKQLREDRKVSLSELAKRSGVQIATLSRMENLRMTGTLESHMKIAEALGVDLVSLYAGVTQEPQTATKKTEEPQSDIFVHSDKSSYEILTKNILAKRMMPILLKIEAGGQTNKEENIQGSEKFLFVLEGTLNVKVGKDTFPLKKHTSLYFDASLEHYIENTGKTTAKAICVVTPVVL